MWEDLLARVRQLAERSDPQVRAAALMRIARVQTALNRDRARGTFEMALEETRLLSGRDRESLLETASLIAAAVAPDLLRETSFPRPLPRRQFWSEKIGTIMLEHGHVDAAFEYAIGCDDPSAFPFSLVSSLMLKLGEEARRSAVLRRAIEVGRKTPDQHFIMFFYGHWKMLPPEEALSVAHDIVRVATDRPDQPITARYGPESPEITSVREHTLFLILHILRHLDNELAESLIGIYEQLAAAARIFPNGIESITEANERRRKEATGESRGGFGFGFAGDPREIPYARAIMQATNDGDFEPAIAQALEKFKRDTETGNSNQAAKEFWPSACAFRQILYAAGKRLGEDAAVYLNRIADEDLRMLAEIELIACLAGLPEFQTVQREYRPRPNRVR